VEVDLVVEGAESFPLARILAPPGRIVELADQRILEDDVSGALIDVVSETVLDAVPRSIPLVCIVHHARASFTRNMLARIDRFVCMTQNAVEFQSPRLGRERIALIPQGVDLHRFRVRPPCSARGKELTPRVLWYTRLNAEKGETLLPAIAELVRARVSLTVLGDGDLFWEISDRFGSEVALINYSPCHSIQNLLPWFDVVVSSGRGAMEALACGVPVLCAGFGYGGPVRWGNVEELLRYNLTGWRSGLSLAGLVDDLGIARIIPQLDCRILAERHFNGDRMARAIRDLIHSPTPPAGVFL
jgi:glycosyltransferase involved in cell wall biosynthesis